MALTREDDTQNEIELQDTIFKAVLCGFNIVHHSRGTKECLRASSTIVGLLSMETTSEAGSGCEKHAPTAPVPKPRLRTRLGDVEINSPISMAT